MNGLYLDIFQPLSKGVFDDVSIQKAKKCFPFISQIFFDFESIICILVSSCTQYLLLLNEVSIYMFYIYFD